MKALLPLHFDIDLTPELSHPIVGAFIDPDVELSESHVACIYEAIQYAQSLMYE